MISKAYQRPASSLLKLPFFSLLLLCVLFLGLTKVSSAPLKLTLNQLQLNANYQAADNKNAPFVIILHGTLAWHGMELPATLQSLLAEEAIGSLAFSLSLSENNRHGFFDCRHPIVSKHQDAQAEILAWVKRIKQLGYKNIVLLGHSRGGAQIAQFSLDHPTLIKQIFLIAPMTWQLSTSENLFFDGPVKLNNWLLQARKTPNQIVNTQKVLHCKAAKISLGSLASYYGLKPIKNTPELLVEQRVATRIYLASNDPEITDSLLEQQWRYKNNQNVSWTIIEDADHYFRDFAAEDVIADMRQHMQ